MNFLKILKLTEIFENFCMKYRFSIKAKIKKKSVKTIFFLIFCSNKNTKEKIFYENKFLKKFPICFYKNSIFLQFFPNIKFFINLQNQTFEKFSN